MNQGMQVPPEAGRGKETNSPLEPAEGKHTCQHLDFSSVKALSDLQNYKTICLCCLKLLNL